MAQPAARQAGHQSRSSSSSCSERQQIARYGQNFNKPVRTLEEGGGQDQRQPCVPNMSHAGSHKVSPFLSNQVGASECETSGDFANNDTDDEQAEGEGDEEADDDGEDEDEGKHELEANSCYEAHNRRDWSKRTGPGQVLVASSKRGEPPVSAIRQGQLTNDREGIGMGTNNKLNDDDYVVKFFVDNNDHTAISAVDNKTSCRFIQANKMIPNNNNNNNVQCSTSSDNHFCNETSKLERKLNHKSSSGSQNVDNNLSVEDRKRKKKTKNNKASLLDDEENYDNQDIDELGGVIDEQEIVRYNDNKIDSTTTKKPRESSSLIIVDGDTTTAANNNNNNNNNNGQDKRDEESKDFRLTTSEPDRSNNSRSNKASTIITSTESAPKNLSKKEVEIKIPSNSQIEQSLENNNSNSNNNSSKKKISNSKKISTYVLNPSGSLCYHWSMIVSFAFLYNFWSLSYRFAFREIDFDTVAFWFAFDYSADFIYILDVIINFHTGYLEDGVLERNIDKISVHYRESTLFYLDCFCLLPLDILYLSIGFNSILRCTRLVKIYKFWSYVDRTERHTNYPNVFRTFTLVHYILVIFHWNACLFHMISKNKIIDIENLYKINDNRCDEILCQYLHAFYWSTLALTTIGDLPRPRTKGEYIYITVELFFGLFLFASVLGHVANIVTNVSAARKEFQAKLDAVKTFMRMRRVSDDLQNKVIRWFDYLWISQKSSDEERSVACLPDRLKAEIAIHVHLDTLKRVDIFQNTEAGFLCELVLRLKPVLFSPGDYVCRKNEVGHEMYIVSRGILEVVTEGGKQVVATLKAGSYFGEISVLNVGLAGNKRTASVRSVGYSDLFCLNKQDLWDVLKNYPNAEARIRARAEERLSKLDIKKHQSAEGRFHSSNQSNTIIRAGLKRTNSNHGRKSQTINNNNSHSKTMHHSTTTTSISNNHRRLAGQQLNYGENPYCSNDNEGPYYYHQHHHSPVWPKKRIDDSFQGNECCRLHRNYSLRSSAGGKQIKTSLIPVSYKSNNLCLLAEQGLSCSQQQNPELSSKFEAAGYRQYPMISNLAPKVHAIALDDSSCGCRRAHPNNCPTTKKKDNFLCLASPSPDAAAAAASSKIKSTNESHHRSLATSMFSQGVACPDLSGACCETNRRIVMQSSGALGSTANIELLSTTTLTNAPVKLQQQLRNQAKTETETESEIEIGLDLDMGTPFKPNVVGKKGGAETFDFVLDETININSDEFVGKATPLAPNRDGRSLITCCDSINKAKEVERREDHNQLQDGEGIFFKNQDCLHNHHHHQQQQQQHGSLSPLNQSNGSSDYKMASVNPNGLRSNLEESCAFRKRNYLASEEQHQLVQRQRQQQQLHLCSFASTSERSKQRIEEQQQQEITLRNFEQTQWNLASDRNFDCYSSQQQPAPILPIDSNAHTYCHHHHHGHLRQEQDLRDHHHRCLYDHDHQLEQQQQQHHGPPPLPVSSKTFNTSASGCCLYHHHPTTTKIPPLPPTSLKPPPSPPTNVVDTPPLSAQPIRGPDGGESFGQAREGQQHHHHQSFAHSMNNISHHQHHQSNEGTQRHEQNKQARQQHGQQQLASPFSALPPRQSSSSPPKSTPKIEKRMELGEEEEGGGQKEGASSFVPSRVESRNDNEGEVASFGAKEVELLLSATEISEAFLSAKTSQSSNRIDLAGEGKQNYSPGQASCGGGDGASQVAEVVESEAPLRAPLEMGQAIDLADVQTTPTCYEDQGK